MSQHVFPEGYFGNSSNESLDKSAKDLMKGLSKYKRKYLASFIQSLPPNAKVMDAGCGKGKTVYMIRILRPDIQIFANDFTDTSDLLPEGTNFLVCDIEELDKHYPKDSFDAIINQHVIEHLVFPTKMMQSFWNVLKPGGRVFIETPNWVRLFIPFSTKYFWDDYTHIHPYSKTAFRRLFFEYGFEEELVTSTISADFFTLPKVIENSRSNKEKKVTPKYKNRSTLVKIKDQFILQIIDPFLRDILIGIAKKPNTNN